MEYCYLLFITFTYLTYDLNKIGYCANGTTCATLQDRAWYLRHAAAVSGCGARCLTSTNKKGMFKMIYSRTLLVDLLFAGCFIGGCVSLPETNQADQTITGSAFCTLGPPLTGSDWLFQVTVSTAPGDAASTVVTSNIAWDTHGTTIPSTASSGPMLSNPATWTYSLIVNGSLVTGSASISIVDNVITGTANNGATCTASPDNSSGG